MDNQESIDIYYKKAQRKAKTNIVWFGIFSIVMFFAGLTSAYIVSKGDAFWVNFTMPSMLWISTIIILLSSFTMSLAVNYSKKKNKAKTVTYLTITLILGIAFGVSQYFAWGQIYDKGYRLSEKIYNPETGEILIDGEYGKDYTIEFQGNPLLLEEGEFRYWGEQAIKIDKEEFDQLSKEKPKTFASKDFVRVQVNKKNRDKPFYEAVVISKMTLSENYKNKLIDTGNVSSSYFYILTVAHLLHIIGALLYLLSMIILASKKELTEDNQLKIKLGGYFWHFFAGLWVYLLLFLFLIH